MSIDGAQRKWFVRIALAASFPAWASFVGGPWGPLLFSVLALALAFWGARIGWAEPWNAAHMTRSDWVDKARRDGWETLAQALDALEGRMREAAEERVRMRERAHAAGRFREEFVAAVRHELKNPLNSILGFTEVLLNEIDGPLTEEQREDVEAIRSAGEYLSELVDDVLAEWAPMRPTPMPLGPVDLPSLFEEVVKLLEGQLREKPVTMPIETADALASPVGDRRRLRQVLVNLGTNAIRATAEGSISFKAANHPDGVRLTVRDTGTGISEAQLPHLFEEFVQAGTEASRPGGSGLGLALCRAMVEWHGGRIEVESELGVGSAFHVILPTELG